jgi:erythromycin esterase
MSGNDTTSLSRPLDVIKRACHPLEGSADLDVLIDEIGDSRYVLLGEASHGTHEYYTWRAHLSKRLIVEKDFTMIAVEGDWPDCYRLNRYIKGYPGSGDNAKDVLSEFNRWPTWMWGNWETAALAEWLRNYNDPIAPDKKVGFYGLDVYSLWESLEAINRYLAKADPSALESVHNAMACFEPFGIKEGFSYAEQSYGLSDSCVQEVEKLLSDIRRNMPGYDSDFEGAFSTEQNALVAVNAERYYHVMMRGGEAAWNIRDRHMSDTVNRLMKFHGKRGKIIIWEHNTHIGDARATNMKRSGLVNVGQLVKEQHDGEGVFRVGFGSYEGTVMAAYHWGGEMHQMRLPRAQEGNWENLLHKAGARDQILLTKDISNLKYPIGHRAVGVVYDPDFETGNYVASIMPERYEAFIYLDKTQALHALHIQPDGLQVPETYPFGV